MSVFSGGKKIIIRGEEIEKEFENRKHVFIVCDPFLAETGKIKYITGKLDNIGVSYTVFSGITPDPSIEIVAEGIAALADVKPDTLVGFGGGSAIDACKAMMFFAEKENIVENCKFIAIPTTSGTGSEVTDFSVISNTKKAVKYPLIDPNLLPDVAVLDAELTLTVPKETTAITGMDVLTHAIEAIVSTDAGDFSDAMAEKAIKLVRSNLLVAYKEPENFSARQGMHNASCMAGIAFNNAGLGLNHGMAHALGAHFHIPHGKANAVLLPYVIGFNAGCFDNLTGSAKTYARIARLIHVDSGSIRQSSLNLIRSIKSFNHLLEMPSNIREMGIAKDDFRDALDSMAEAAYADSCTKTNPRKASVDEIKKVYAHAYFGAIGRSL